jgi:DNA-binding HxlR family transcriptional regulator
VKRYQQYCGLAKALDVVGGRWTLLIVRDLLLGPRRYGEIRGSLPGLTTNLLASRLKEMEEAEILHKTSLHGMQLYALTERGRELEPAILALGAWGWERMQGGPEADDRLDLRWGILSMKRRYSGRESGHVCLIAGERRFDMRFSPELLDFQEREAIDASARIQGSLEQVRAWLFMGASFEPLKVQGDLSAVARFRSGFGLP